MTADQNFTVTAGGGGGNDPSVGATSFTVTIASRPNTYAVSATLAGVTNVFGLDIESLTSTSFVVAVTAPLVSGDKISFNVYDVANTTVPPPASNVVVLSSGSGTYTPTTGTTRVWLRMVGGGGGGGGASAGAGPAAAGGGSGGVFLEKWIDPSAAVTGGAYSVGAGGAGGTTTPGVGGGGGDTTVVIQGVTYTAKGGHGGGPMSSGTTNTFSAPSPSTTGSGASSGSVDVLSQQVGGWGYRISSSLAISGNGASSFFGTGGDSLVSQNTGNAGTGNGSGGGGAMSNGTAHVGGAGTSGCIVIYEYT